MRLLHLKNCSIYEQLQLEEFLLRTNTDNWCLLNEGSPLTIVLGISNNPVSHVDLSLVKKDNVPLLQRFSGGGTVVVDENTLFVTFICQKDFIPQCQFSSEILVWAEEFYRDALKLTNFQLRENDFIIDDKKIGGNAQYLRKERWLHHTSFLYDFEEENMNYLLFPPKTPHYRKLRSHRDFLGKLKPLFSKGEFIERIKRELYNRYAIQEIARETLFTSSNQIYRKNVKFLE